MREIKFRAWDFDNKEMITADGDGCCFVMYDGKPELLVCYGEGHGFMKCNHVMLQYTGLKDKDGVEIYEGDVYNHGDTKILYVVEWKGCGLIGRQISNQSTTGIGYWSSTIKVIGNIYENPELLSC